MIRGLRSRTHGVGSVAVSSGSAAAVSVGRGLRDAGSLSANEAVAYAHSMTTPVSDSALMLRYADGDAAAFETLYRRHNDALFRYLLRLCGSRAMAEDVYQEAWTRIIRARERYRPTAKFTTFLYRVAQNCFIDGTRRNRRYGGGPAPADLLCDGSGPEEATERANLRQRLFDALADLPFEQRDAFLLHEEAGLSIDDIAHTTGVNRETAKSRLRYANVKLKKALAENANPAAHGSDHD